jgi:ribonuclease VapC
MIVIDLSAVVAILCGETEAQRYSDIMEAADGRYLSAANMLETSMVMHNRLGAVADRSVDEFLSDAEVEVVNVTRQTADIAFAAFRQFGKGTGRPGVLNFGDCFSYALARELELPLLFKGNDFSRTDIQAATEVYS